MPKAIITGATGYIGSHVARHLLDQGWSVAIIADPRFGYVNIEDIKSQLDIFEYDGDIDTLIQFFKDKQADVVMHLAAAVITNYNPEQVSTLIRSNIEFGTQILEAMTQSETKLFIGTGSYWQNYNSEEYNPVDLYAATKEAFEKILQYYVDAKGLRAITLRLFDVYGEDDRRPKLWNTLKEIAGTDRSIDLSPGEQMLDMVHISDVASAYEAAYALLMEDVGLFNEVFGVMTGEQRTLKEVVNLFQKIIDRPINLNWGAKPYKKREVMYPFENYKILPNWKYKVDLFCGFSMFRCGREVF